MRKVAAYILERTEGLEWLEARTAEGERLQGVVDAWLKTKGGSPTAAGAGTFKALDGSEATYIATEARDGDRSWRMVELSEVTPEGRKFVTSVSVTVGASKVVVFITMAVGAVETSISRVDHDARCPQVVRNLLDLELPGPWRHGASRLLPLSKVDGPDEGETLALELLNEERTVPFVVVSRTAGHPALPRLDEELARDLRGLANVYSIDEEASWALTDYLRHPLSTHSGGLRIYWPGLSMKSDPFEHQLWTGAKLQGLQDDPQAGLKRLRRKVRGIIMGASAASVVRPSEIDDIRNATTRAEYASLQAKAKALEELKAKATSLEELQVLAEQHADLYAADNAQLRQQLEERDVRLEDLEDQLKRAETENQNLRVQLQYASSASSDEELAPDAPEVEEANEFPEPGEIRFYKKHHDIPSRDVMLRIADCAHSTWQGAAGADKAKKGIAHLEGTNEWKTVQHCGTCKGGGVWRVKW